MRSVFNVMRQSRIKQSYLVAVVLMVAQITLAVPRVHAELSVSGENVLQSFSPEGGLAGYGVQNSNAHSISCDGRYVVFGAGLPSASNPSGVTRQIFVRDNLTHTTTIASVSPSGEPADANYPAGSAEPSTPTISCDGRYVAFSAGSQNLAPNVGSNETHVYIHDMLTGATNLVDTDNNGNRSTGAFLPDISSDGTHIAFYSHSLLDPNVPTYSGGQAEIFVKNLLTGTLRMASVGPDGSFGTRYRDGQEVFGGSKWPRLSCDGSKVVFWSAAQNLVPNDTHVGSDTFLAVVDDSGVHVTGVSQLAGISGTTQGLPSISCDGRYVLTTGADATGTVHIFRYDTQTQTIQQIDADGSQLISAAQAISDDGRYILYSATSSPTATDLHAYVRDVSTGQTVQADVDANGQSANSTTTPNHSFAMTQDGKYVVYLSNATNLSATPMPQTDNGYIWTQLFRSKITITGSDTTPPSVTGIPDRSPDNGTWYNHDVTINWTATDDSNSATTPPPNLVSTEGENQNITSSPSCDPSNNCATGSISVSLDKTKPTLAIPTWVNNPKTLSGTGSNATMTLIGTDNVSGIAKAEYFIGDTDPGQGNGAAMIATNQRLNSDGTRSADISTTFGTDFTIPGRYAINVRTQDKAGIWSDVATDYLVVFDQSGPTNVAGNKQIVPSSNNGDVLPGLATAGKNDKANLGFDVSYTPSGTVAAGSYATLNYAIGNACKNHPENCLTTTFTANTTSPNSIDWLVIANSNTTGTFQGKGTLVINDHGTSTTSQNPFRVTTNTGNPSTAVLSIYAVGANPATATPLYQLHVSASGSWIKIQ